MTRMALVPVCIGLYLYLMCALLWLHSMARKSKEFSRRARSMLNVSTHEYEAFRSRWNTLLADMKPTFGHLHPGHWIRTWRKKY